MAPRSYGDEDGAAEDPNQMRILIATDNHLGFGEKYPERQMDSFTTFDEILQIAKEKDVDFVLLGGDLFHENRPTRFTEHNCIKILKKHVFGDRPVEVEYVSDPDVNFAHCAPEHRNVNYMDPNLNIAMPIFSIHGNHDDPCGLGGYCSLDNIHTAGLVNYFGKIDNFKEITVNPLLFKKGDAKLALYGMSHVKDERLHRLFRENSVKLLRPEEDTDSWFNILVLHQNRNPYGGTSTSTNYIPAHFIDGMVDLVVWGHEHQCLLQPELTVSGDKEIFISQPGSSVATSLCEAESAEKYVGILHIKGKQFKMEEIKLKTVRPMIFKNISLFEETPDFKPPFTKDCTEEKDIQGKVYDAIVEYVEKVLRDDLPDKLTGDPNQPTQPLVRVRIEYIDDRQTLSVGRFGNHFMDRIANPADILIFKKMTRAKMEKAGVDFSDQQMQEIADHVVYPNIEELIETYFADNKDNLSKRLELLGVKGMGTAVQEFVDKKQKRSVIKMVDQQFKKTVEKLNTMEIDSEETFDEALGQYRESRTAKQEEKEALEILSNVKDDEVDMEIVRPTRGSDCSDIEEMDAAVSPPKPKRGRGSSRGGGPGSRGGRGSAKASEKQTPLEINSTRPTATSSSTSSRGGRGSRGGNRAVGSTTGSTTGARGRAKPQLPFTSTQKSPRSSRNSIQNAFARQSQKSQLNCSTIPSRSQRNALTFESDSESD